MSDLPSTIKHPDTFLKSPSAGFDGVFDWSWTQGCFGEKKITPMDFDGLVERKGNFILFETKKVGVEVPEGQLYTFKSAYKLGCFTILFIQGKEKPEFVKAWCQPNFYKGKCQDEYRPIPDLEKVRQLVSDWYEFADRNPRKNINISFLNKKITSLTSTVEKLKIGFDDAVNTLGGTINWRK